MSEINKKEATAVNHAETAGTHGRFRKQTPSRESMQEDYDQNMLGATAGFFCAIWAGHLMGERLSMALTTWSAADQHSRYHLTLGDIGAIVLLATKLLFARTLLLKYVLRPAAGYVGIQEFENRQRMAEGTGIVVWRAVSLAAAAMCAYMGSDSSGMSAVERAYAILRSAGSVATLILAALEGEFAHKRVALAYLELGALLAASMLDDFQLFVSACLVVDLPALVAALADTLQVAVIHSVSKAVNLAALAVGVPWLIHRSVAMSPKQSLPDSADDAAHVMLLQAIFCGSLLIRACFGIRSDRLLSG